ncbi:MAG: hypothetical protein RI884_2904 [Pseudomonadota bacterium]|jgi:putative lipoic acid-binding regulatory protein
MWPPPKRQRKQSSDFSKPIDYMSGNPPISRLNDAVKGFSVTLPGDCNPKVLTRDAMEDATQGGGAGCGHNRAWLPELPPMTTPVPPASRADSLIEYPCRFPIKVMGAKVAGFVEAVTAVAAAFDPGFDAAGIELRDSKGGNYLGITITITATSREQLDELYRTLSTHPMVRVVL